MSFFRRIIPVQYHLMCFNYMAATKNALQGCFYAIHLDEPMTFFVPGKYIKGKVIRCTDHDGKIRTEPEGEDHYFHTERMYNVGLYESAQKMVEEKFPELL